MDEINFEIIYEGKYLKEKPKIRIITAKIKEGIHYLYVDVGSRLNLNSSGGEDGWEELYFSEYNEDETILVVRFQDPTEESALIFGEMSKSTFHGTFYGDKAYSNLLKDL